MKKKTGKSLTRKFDKLWREQCMERSGFQCEYCKNTYTLNVHHIIGRRNYSTRWYIPNGIVLCSKHHTFDSDFSAHQNPLEFGQWLLKNRGQAWWDDVMKQKNKIWRNWKLNLEKIEKHLLEDLKNDNRRSISKDVE